MSLGLAPTGGRPVAGDTTNIVLGAPLEVNWTAEGTAVNPTDIEWTNDTTLTVTHEPGVAG